MADENTSPYDVLPVILTSPDYHIGTGILMAEQNVGKTELICSILGQYGFKEMITVDRESQKSYVSLINSNTISTPVIEFKKINPIKYRIMVHGAKDSFPLIFSESFHNGWKAYVVRTQRPEIKREYINEYKVLEGNEGSQADLAEIKYFLDRGWVSSVGDGAKKRIVHKVYGQDGEKWSEQVENYTVDFISKNFKGTIQNDNLINGSFMDTWFAGKVGFIKDTVSSDLLQQENWKVTTGLNDKLVQWPDILHWYINGYANCWWIEINGIKKTGSYFQNTDGSIDFELLVEFWPQRLFYVGSLISGLTFITCILLLIWKKSEK